MKLILTRHGETIENKKGVLQGQLPGHLSELGIKQAKKLALRLKDEKIDFIYSSDLARAADTAKEIIKYHKKTPVYFVKGLRERDHGKFNGKSSKEIDWDNLPDDVETRSSVQNRVKEFLDNVYKKHPTSTVLFVAHGMVNKVLTTIIMNKHVDFVDELESQHNTAVNIFEIKEDKNHIVHLMNCVKHLE